MMRLGFAESFRAPDHRKRVVGKALVRFPRPGLRRVMKRLQQDRRAGFPTPAPSTSPCFRHASNSAEGATFSWAFLDADAAAPPPVCKSRPVSRLPQPASLEFPIWRHVKPLAGGRSIRPFSQNAIGAATPLPSRTQGLGLVLLSKSLPKSNTEPRRGSARKVSASSVPAGHSVNREGAVEESAPGLDGRGD